MSKVREQLETLVAQNFKDAWGEWKMTFIGELMEQGNTLVEIEEGKGIKEMQREFLIEYWRGLETVLQKKGLIL